MPAVKPFSLSPRDFEPIDPNNKKFKSPVFIVDPMFTEEMKDEEIVVFRDNDWAGWKQPLVHSRFPFLRKEVQKFFTVNEDCSCKKDKPVEFKEPQYHQVSVAQHYAPFFEPLYENPQCNVPANNQHDCFRGDDYGGHNYPFPHPAPPKPSPFYDDAFVDLSKVFASQQ